MRLRSSGVTAARRSSLRNPSMRKNPAVGSGPNAGGAPKPDMRPTTNPINSRFTTSDATRPAISQRLVRIGVAFVVRKREQADIRCELFAHAAGFVADADCIAESERDQRG